MKTLSLNAKTSDEERNDLENEVANSEKSKPFQVLTQAEYDQLAATAEVQLGNKSYVDLGKIWPKTAGYNLSGLSMPNLHCSSMRFYDIQFNGSVIHSGAFLDSTFSCCTLDNASMKSSDLRYAMFISSNISNADFTSSNLDNACIIITEADDTKFVRASLRNVSIEVASFNYVDFTEADLSGSTFNDVYFKGCVFSDAILANAKFIDCTFYDSELSNGDFFNDTFKSGDVMIEDADNCQMRRIEVIDSDLDTDMLEGTNWRGAVFENCVLRHIDNEARGIDLKGASLDRTTTLTVEQQSSMRRQSDKLVVSETQGGNVMIQNLNYDLFGTNDAPYEISPDGSKAITQWEYNEIVNDTLCVYPDTFMLMDFTKIWPEVCDYDLSGINLGKIYTEMMPIDSAKLCGAYIERGQLQHSRFYRCDLSYASFKGSNLESAYFCRSELDGTDFTGANLNGAIFSGGVYREVVFRDADLRCCDFSDVTFEDSIFDGVKINGMEFSQTKFNKCSFKNIDFSDFSASNCVFTVSQRE